jgi:UPF0271 protein
VDLNADVGEGFGTYALTDDAGLLAVVTSANVACGFHGGDPATIARCCALAVRHGVRLGAHVGLRDLHGFGRRRMEVTAAALEEEAAYQVGALVGVARGSGVEVAHLKPHGALYAMAAEDPGKAEALAAAAARAAPVPLALVGPAGSALEDAAAAAGLRFLAEGFADRGYAADGRLLARDRPGALLVGADAAAQARSIALDGVATTAAGTPVVIRAETLCVHGDGQHAVATAAAVRDALRAAGVDVAAPA